MAVALGFGLGLAMFFISLRVMSSFLVKGAGDRLKQVLAKAVGNQYWGFLLGILVTGVTQSSSAVNVTAVGMVGSGILQFDQAMAIILGANVGTTVTAQIAALPLVDYGLYVAVFGFAGWLMTRRQPVLGHISGAVTGLGGLFVGLQLMQTSLAPLAQSAAHSLAIVSKHYDPVVLITFGTAVTAVMQSSSAVVGMVIALVKSGLVSPTAGVCFVLGSNIGTVVTSLLASIGMNRQAKRVAAADLLFNIIGVACVYPFLGQFSTVVSFLSRDVGALIANAHTLFNMVTSLAVLPLVPVIARVMGASPQRWQS